jgi:hypothetical protein
MNTRHLAMQFDILTYQAKGNPQSHNTHCNSIDVRFMSCKRLFAHPITNVPNLKMQNIKDSFLSFN